MRPVYRAFECLCAALRIVPLEGVLISGDVNPGVRVEQKAREGKWNGGFAPYGYKLEDGNLVIAEDEVEVIRVIYDRYIHTNEGVAGVAKYLNRNGYVKKLRQNNTTPGFSRDFVKNVLYNPVYMGKIAYGRRRTEKKQGTRNGAKSFPW